MDKWQPMDTAPKDELILVYTDRECWAIVEWHERLEGWAAVVDEGLAQFTEDGERRLWLIDPIRWMPLSHPKDVQQSELLYDEGWRKHHAA